MSEGREKVLFVLTVNTRIESVITSININLLYNVNSNSRLNAVQIADY